MIYENEAAVEAAIDARVQRRLATDPRYRNAENAEEQAEAEDAIEREVVAQVEAEVAERRALDRMRAARDDLMDNIDDYGVPLEKLIGP